MFTFEIKIKYMTAILTTEKLEKIIELVGKAYQENIANNESDFIREAKNKISQYLELPDLFNCK